MKKMKKLLVILLTIAMFANIVSPVSLAAENDIKDLAVVEENENGDENRDSNVDEEKSDVDEENQDSEGSSEDDSANESEENQESGECSEEQDSDNSEEIVDEEADDDISDEESPDDTSVEDVGGVAKSSASAYIKSVSMNLDGEFGIYIYIDCTEVYALGVGVPHICFNDENFISLGSESELGDVSNVCVSYSVSAKEINSNFYFQIYSADEKLIMLKNKNKLDDDGNYVEYENDAYVFCVNDYLEDVSVSSEVSDTFKTLAYSMKVYGQKAQQYFGYALDTITTNYNVAEIPLADISKYEKTIDTTNLPRGLSYIGTSLILDKQIVIRHYFKYDSDEADNPIDEIGFAIIGQDDCVIQKKGSYYYIEVKDIPAPKFGTAHTLKIDENEVISYSVMSYVYDVINEGRASEKMLNLCKALYWYYKSAADYFG